MLQVIDTLHNNIFFHWSSPRDAQLNSLDGPQNFFLHDPGPKLIRGHSNNTRQLGGGGFVTKFHKGREGVSQSVTWHFFKKNSLQFGSYCLFMDKFNYCHVTHRRGEGLQNNVTKWHKEEGSKIGQKSVTHYLNDPYVLTY